MKQMHTSYEPFDHKTDETFKALEYKIQDIVYCVYSL